MARADVRAHQHPAVVFSVPRVATLDVLLRGEIHRGNAPAIVHQVCHGIRRQRPVAVRVDLAGVTYAESSALRMLTTVARAADEVCASFHMRNASPQVRRTMMVTGLSSALGLGASFVDG